MSIKRWLFLAGAIVCIVLAVMTAMPISMMPEAMLRMHGMEPSMRQEMPMHKVNRIGYRSMCSFTPISTLILLGLGGIFVVGLLPERRKAWVPSEVEDIG